MLVLLLWFVENSDELISEEVTSSALIYSFGIHTLVNMVNLKYPFKIQELSKEDKELTEFYGDYDLVRIVPSKFCAPRRVEKYGPELYNFKPRPDDIWLIGYPRSGTTLTQEILYLLGTDLDYATAASTIMDERFPYLEDVLIRSDEEEAQYEEFCKKNREPGTPEEIACLPSYKKLERASGRRFIKSHFGFDLLHPQLLEFGCKVIFIARNVKDCLVSTYFFPLNFKTKSKYGIDTTWKLHKRDLDLVSNHLEMLKGAWERRHNKNLLILFYEDMNKDKRSTIKKISDFLGKQLTEEELDKLVDHVDIKKFRENKSLNNDHLVESGVYVKNEKSSFIRNGRTGGWRDTISAELSKDIDEWFLERIKEIPDFELPECWKKSMDL